MVPFAKFGCSWYCLPLWALFSLVADTFVKDVETLLSCDNLQEPKSLHIHTMRWALIHCTGKCVCCNPNMCAFLLTFLCHYQKAFQSDRDLSLAAKFIASSFAEVVLLGKARNRQFAYNLCCSR